MTTTYPEQLMLAGQAAAPGGPVDMTIMYLMHHGFRRDLRSFATAVPATPVDDHATWVALADRWSRFSEILHHHHSGEDAGIWPFLLERADPHERETLLAMEAEHDLIDPQLEACSELFARLASGSVDDHTRAALAVRLAETRESLGSHLRHEESEAMAILQRHMTPEDWERIDEEHFGDKRKDLRFLLFVVSWIAEELPRDVRERVLKDAGLPMVVIYRLGRRRFARTEAKAFRYA